MTAMDSLWLIPLLPFLGAALNGVLGPRVPKSVTTAVALGAPGASLLVALWALWQYRLVAPTPIEQVMYPWTAGPLEINVAFLLDPLSAVMTFVVTFVGFWIHVYSVGYMHHEKGYQRYFVYLNLFMGMMLLLVLGNNYLVTFVGWEGVGLCSYLLIGYYYQERFAAEAGRKAFIVNRIGDFAFLVALFALIHRFGTLDYQRIFAAVEANPAAAQVPYALGIPFAAFVAGCLFIGATGKSAQLPLYVWLPDAMAGPTPVSALIHAATMVTAGVYLVARSASIFELSPTAQVTVATVGAATALWAASIAIAQYDIKKVLAYSTISQLGYMFMAVGATAYVSGVFHLMTHAFFKALLFLGAGAVIHAMADEQDMRKMGGLFKEMPVTAITMGIATLAIAGIPPLAGFWSKDEILGSLFERGGWFAALWVVGLITALMTAFYMARQWVTVFWGEPRWAEGVHPHKTPRVMTVPLVVLAGLSVVGGFVNTPFRLTLEHFLEPVFEGVSVQHPPEGWLMFAVLAAVSVLAGLAGVAAAAFAYRGPAEDWSRLEQGLQPVWGWWESAYRVDDLYDATVVQPGKKVSEVAAFGVDASIIDGAVNGVGRLMRDAGQWVRTVQSGQVRNYAALLFAGAIALVVWLAVTGA